MISVLRGLKIGLYGLQPVIVRFLLDLAKQLLLFRNVGRFEKLTDCLVVREGLFRNYSILSFLLGPGELGAGKQSDRFGVKMLKTFATAIYQRMYNINIKSQQNDRIMCQVCVHACVHASSLCMSDGVEQYL